MCIAIRRPDIRRRIEFGESGLPVLRAAGTGTNRPADRCTYSRQIRQVRQVIRRDAETSRNDAGATFTRVSIA
jgi:hypothetical protein